MSTAWSSSAPSRAPSPVLDLPLLVLRNQVLFPGSEQTVEVFREPSRRVVAALSPGDEVAALVQSDPTLETPGAGDLAPVGVVARVLSVETRPDGNLRVRLAAERRVRLVDADPAGERPSARVEVVADPPADPVTADRVAGLVAELTAVLPPDVPALVDAARGDGSALSRLVDAVVDAFAVSIEERLAALQVPEPAERARALDPMVERKRAWVRTVQDFRIPPLEELEDLWPLREDAEERIAAKLASGEITAQEADELRRYRELGYVVWEGLIPPDEVDALVADVRSIREHPGRFLTTDHRRGYGYRFSGTDFDAYESIFDTYVNFESARRVCFHPRILRFLELLFECRPVAMQQLLFQRSNQHPMHQDTAYVRVQEPLQLAATWIALEDVVEGRGELAYYEGSHRIPHQAFHGGAKWFDLERDDADAAIRHVVDESERLGCARRSFLARKGDVFLWAADLVHGSNPRTRPDEETRLSCVTHYVPETAKPLWFLFSPDRRGLEPYGERAFLASSHYELPRRSPGLVQPTFKLPLPC